MGKNKNRAPASSSAAQLKTTARQADVDKLSKRVDAPGKAGRAYGGRASHAFGASGSFGTEVGGGEGCDNE